MLYFLRGWCRHRTFCVLTASSPANLFYFSRLAFLCVDAQDKYVVLGPGDNLGRLAKQNGTTVADIAKWNGIRDTRQLGVGVKLIVAKGLHTAL